MPDTTTKPTPSERLLASGARDADAEGVGWGDQSMLFTEHYAFARTGASNSKLHIANVDHVDLWIEVGNALCGVGVDVSGVQTLNALYDREHCPRCLRTIEKGLQS